MASTAPTGFKDIRSASTQIDADVNVMGIVTDVRRSCKSKGSDWMCTFSISDLTFGETEEGLLVRFFRPMEMELPQIQGTGDVVILRRIKLKEWSGRTMAMSNKTTSWVVFPSDSIPEKAPPRFRLTYVKDQRSQAPLPAEMEYAMLLCNSRDRSTFRKVSEPSSHTAGDGDLSSQGHSVAHTSAQQQRQEKFSMIKDVTIDRYHDLVGQVVKIYPANGNVELYITDYTSNSFLYNYEWGIPSAEDADPREGDEFGHIPRNSAGRKWPGPFGRYTLTVTLWPAHCYFAQANVKEGDFVYLRNVHIKHSKDGKVEGSLHTDQKYPEKVDITKLDDHRDERVKNVLRRKLEYSQRFEAQSQSFINEARGQKRKVCDDAKHMSRAQARKKKKQHKELASRASPKAQDIERPDQNRSEDTVRPPNPHRQDLNRNIHCSHSLIPPRSLSSIISLEETHGYTTPNGTLFTLPFQNINCRSTVRIVDFFPPEIADFAVPRARHSEFDVLSEHEANESSDPQSQDQKDEDRRWEWRFALVLEDAKGSRSEKKARLRAYVADQDAVFLLKLDAEDLRASPQALSTLREKLFLLWGDLEELKSQAKTTSQLEQDRDRDQDSPVSPKSKPFECCLKEYGIRKICKELMADKVTADDQGYTNNVGIDDEEIHVWERRWRLWGTTIT